MTFEKLLRLVLEAHEEDVDSSSQSGSIWSGVEEGPLTPQQLFLKIKERYPHFTDKEARELANKKVGEATYHHGTGYEYAMPTDELSSRHTPEQLLSKVKEIYPHFTDKEAQEYADSLDSKSRRFFLPKKDTHLTPDIKQGVQGSQVFNGNVQQYRPGSKWNFNDSLATRLTDKEGEHKLKMYDKDKEGNKVLIDPSSVRYKEVRAQRASDAKKVNTAFKIALNAGREEELAEAFAKYHTSYDEMNNLFRDITKNNEMVLLMRDRVEILTRQAEKAYFEHLLPALNFQGVTPEMREEALNEVKSVAESHNHEKDNIYFQKNKEQVDWEREVQSKPKPVYTPVSKKKTEKSPQRDAQGRVVQKIDKNKNALVDVMVSKTVNVPLSLKEYVESTTSEVKKYLTWRKNALDGKDLSETEDPKAPGKPIVRHFPGFPYKDRDPKDKGGYNYRPGIHDREAKIEEEIIYIEKINEEIGTDEAIKKTLSDIKYAMTDSFNPATEEGERSPEEYYLSAIDAWVANRLHIMHKASTDVDASAGKWMLLNPIFSLLRFFTNAKQNLKVRANKLDWGDLRTVLDLFASESKLPDKLGPNHPRKDMYIARIEDATKAVPPGDVKERLELELSAYKRGNVTRKQVLDFLMKRDTGTSEAAPSEDELIDIMDLVDQPDKIEAQAKEEAKQEVVDVMAGIELPSEDEL